MFGLAFDFKLILVYIADLDMQNILSYFSDPLMIVMQSLQQLGTNQEVAFVTHHDCSI